MCNLLVYIVLLYSAFVAWNNEKATSYKALNLTTQKL